MTKLSPEWVRTSDPVIRSPARYRWTTAPASQSSIRSMWLVLVTQTMKAMNIIGSQGRAVKNMHSQTEGHLAYSNSQSLIWNAGFRYFEI